MIASHDANGATIHFSAPELRDIMRLTGAMNNPNSTHFETQIMIDLFNSIWDEEQKWAQVDSLSKAQLEDVFSAHSTTPAKEERPL